MTFDFKKAHNYAVILMAGKGLRMNQPLPKQFMEVAGLPLFLYATKTINQSEYIDYVIFVTGESEISRTEEILSKANMNKPYSVIAGSDAREKSARNAIEFLKKNGCHSSSVVLIHDADRPNITLEIIENNIAKARTMGAAITAAPSVNSLASVVNGVIASYLNRDEVYQIQTPQTFAFEVISKAFDEVGDPTLFTDEGSLVLKGTGIGASIVKATNDNYKITTEIDLELFEKGRK